MAAVVVFCLEAFVGFLVVRGGVETWLTRSFWRFSIALSSFLGTRTRFQCLSCVGDF